MSENGAVLARRLKSIAQLPEEARFTVLGDGLLRLAESVAVLAKDAESLGEEKRHRGAAILRGFADEEAAKIMIILDIARAGWANKDAVSASMSNFYNHLARGLYVRAYDGSPADLAEVRRYLDYWRQQYYLDGPMEVDWIFGNEVLAGREERLYVDYIEDEDGDRRWVGPADREAAHDTPFRFPAPPSQIVVLANAMQRTGLLNEDGLILTRMVWDGIVPIDTMHWSDLRPLNMKIVQTLVGMSNGKVSMSDAEDVEALRVVLDHWIFPLTTLDLNLTKVDIADLKRQREEWLAREMGYSDGAGL